MSSSLIVNATATGANVTDATTRYFPLAGRVNPISTEDQQEIPIRDAGVFSNLYTYVDANTASVTSVITLRDSNADTAVTVSYTSDQTGVKEDTSNTATLAATDTADYSVVVPSEAGTNNIHITLFSIQFDPTDTSKCVSFFTNISAVNLNDASATYFFTVNGRIADSIFAEAQANYRARASFTCSDFYTYVISNARTTDVVVKTRKNSGDGSMSVTYTSGQTGAKEDTSNSDSLVADDDICYAVVTGTGTENINLNLISMSCISTAGYFPMLNASTVGIAIGVNNTKFDAVAGTLILNATEALSQTLPRFDFTASELGAYVSANDSTLSACTITLRDNGGDSALTISYSAGQTGLKNDSSNSVTITGGTDEIGYEITNSDLVGGPTITWIGCLGSTAVAPPATTYISKAMLMGVG